ncbi:phospholipase A-2-activating protein-like isoform X2 [Centruroides sculpturatus]|uniref:phospholipase A-2-activating protein-like isoform X2 n=1 Tax=Centruroides sculpturatus TaxID=218467 RepID=UPI000C6EA16A|nr:phospholipase A-2-activating protein-like isoform X2 [Centruroides sculpturatus]
MAGFYKLRCTLLGHSDDVRAVAPAYYPEGGIITGSRDRTIRLWTPNNNEVNYSEAHCMIGMTKYVSSVCALPPSDQYPFGLILAGCNDCAIYGFSIDSPQPVYKLLGHAGTVCSLSAGNYGTVLSGSWDKTAKIWLGQQCTVTLEGHQAAVWAVQILPEQGLMLTASADKTIRMWRSGKCEKIFTGHTDCVRGLAVLSTREFLSCSSDATIRHWHITGECLNIYYGHTNYIYSICVMPGNEGFVTCGEDRTVRLWRDGECYQVMRLPANSVWAVACLQNGDIVAGASDGTARIFTHHSELQASPEEQLRLEDEVSKSILPAQELDLKLDSILEKDVLNEPGKKNGQVVIVREGSEITAHQWNAPEGKWVKVGDVVGASGSANKIVYEGEEYDYVFDVELEQGKSLKLPYNVTDDPWQTAQQFIHKHDLSQLFLDQTANFIINNTRGITLGQMTPIDSDPFTGGSRYLPGTVQSPLSPNGTDPFTGQKRYQTETAGDCQKGDKMTIEDTVKNTYFPQAEFVKFDLANIDGITSKMKEFNNKVPVEQQLADDELTELLQLIQPSKEPTNQQMASLEKIIHWPKEMVFPGLDILRLAVREINVNRRVCEAAGMQLINHLLTFLFPESQPANKMLALRTLSNLFTHPPGEKLLASQRERILNFASHCSASDNKNVQISLATLYLNYAVLLQNSTIEIKSQCLNRIFQALSNYNDSEAQFRLLVSLGTFIWKDEPAINYAKLLDFPAYVEKMTEVKDPSKVGLCAEYLLSVFYTIN